MMSCKMASHLISDAMDRRLSRWERLSLGWHLLVCRLCKRYQRQLMLIRIVLKSQARVPDAATEANPSLSPDARERIRQAISRVA